MTVIKMRGLLLDVAMRLGELKRAAELPASERREYYGTEGLAVIAGAALSNVNELKDALEMADIRFKS